MIKRIFIISLLLSLCINCNAKDDVALPYSYYHYSEVLKHHEPNQYGELYDSLANVYRKTKSIKLKQDVVSFILDSLADSYYINLNTLTHDYDDLKNKILTKSHRIAISKHIKDFQKDQEKELYIEFVGRLQDTTFLKDLQYVDSLEGERSNLLLEATLIRLGDKNIVKKWKNEISNIATEENSRKKIAAMLSYIKELQINSFYSDLINVVLLYPDILVFNGLPEPSSGNRKFSILVNDFLYETLFDFPLIPYSTYTEWGSKTNEDKFLEEVRKYKKGKKLNRRYFNYR